MAFVKRWSFTLNNPGDRRPVWNEREMDYLIYQLEEGEEHTPHVQGYVRFKNRKRMRGVLDALNLHGVHVEAAIGTEQHNHDYCSKQEGQLEPPMEHGSYDPGNGTQGRRTDLKKAIDMIKGGSNMRQIAEENPEVFVKYGKGLRELQTILQVPPREREINVRIIWGPTGTGKTHYVMTNFEDVFVVAPGRSPWDGYTGQAVVLFDEFDDALWPLPEMLKILDKWRYECSARYYNKPALWNTVFLVSNSDPQNWYKFSPPAQRDAFFRRIRNIEYIGEPYIQPATEPL